LGGTDFGGDDCGTEELVFLRSEDGDFGLMEDGDWDLIEDGDWDLMEDAGAVPEGT